MHLYCLLKLHDYLYQPSVFSCGFKSTVLGYRHFLWSAFSSQVGHTFLFLWYFVLSLFEEIGLPFWVPGIFHQHSEVVLWKLLHTQMFFWWICGRESGLPILFLCHLRTAPLFSINYWEQCWNLQLEFWIFLFFLFRSICFYFMHFEALL